MTKTYNRTAGRRRLALPEGRAARPSFFVSLLGLHFEGAEFTLVKTAVAIAVGIRYLRCKSGTGCRFLRVDVTVAIRVEPLERHLRCAGCAAADILGQALFVV